MLAPLVLPFQLTIALLVVVWLVANLSYRKQGFAAKSFLLALVAFVPVLIGVQLLVDHVRYGKFEYATASELAADGYVELPPDATDIVVYRSGGGHQARFSVDPASLQDWIDRMQAKRRDLNNPAVIASNTPELFHHRFEGTSWSYEPGMQTSHVTRNDRGGGFTVWYVPGSDVAFLAGGYW